MPRHMMSRAVVASAFLALAVVLVFEFSLANGRAEQARPTVVSVEEALVQLRAGAPTPAASAPTATLGEVKASYALSVQALDSAWTALPTAASERLTQPQRVWIWRRNAGCESAGNAAASLAATEVQRLTCRGQANLARAAWLKQNGTQDAATPSEAGGPATTPATAMLAPAAACAWLRARGQHLGETVSFEGAYVNDHASAALVRPIGCDQAIVLREMAPGARMSLDQVDAPPLAGQPRPIVALFTARLVGAGAPGGADDAIRLQVESVANPRTVANR